MITSERRLCNADWVIGTNALELVRDEWLSLQERGGAASFFQTWEWLSTWWRWFGRGTPAICRIRENGSVIGLAPCFISHSPGRPLRWIGTGLSDHLNVLALEHHRKQVEEAFAISLRGMKGAAYADLHQLPEDCSLLADHPEHRLLQSRSVRLALPSTWDEYLRSLSSKMRSNLKRARRDLEALGDWCIRRLSPQETDFGMEALYRLNARRWRSRGLPGSFLTGAARGFHLEWARQAASKGMLRLYVLEVGGRPVSALYGVRHDKVFAYYQSGFDPVYQRLSPGALLVARAIEDAIEEGCTWFDFLRGQEWYKSRWKAEDVGNQYRLILPLSGLSGRMCVSMVRKLHGVECKLRRRFEGGSLFGKP